MKLTTAFSTRTQRNNSGQQIVFATAVASRASASPADQRDLEFPIVDTMLLCRAMDVSASQMIARVEKKE